MGSLSTFILQKDARFELTFQSYIMKTYSGKNLLILVLPEGLL